MSATPNSAKVRGEAKSVTSERAQRSSRNETDTSCEARRKTFHRMAPPRNTAIAFGTRAPARETNQVRSPQTAMSMNGQ